MKTTLFQKYGPIFKKIVKRSDPDLFAQTTADNVFQPAQKQNRRYFQYIMNDLMNEGSGIEGLENLKKLHSLARQGKSTLILSAHFTNFDVPALYSLMRAEGKEVAAIFEDIVFIAGRKLTEGTKYVKALAEMFTRLVISAKAANMTPDEIKLALAINKASQKKLAKIQKSGHIFVLYPTGTRSRLTAPQSFFGMREIFNYVKKFDYFVCCGIDGIILPARDDCQMIEEYPKKDRVIYRFGKLHETQAYLEKLEHQFTPEEQEDKKQAVIDHIMNEIYSLGEDPRKNTRYLALKYNPYMISVANGITNTRLALSKKLRKSKARALRFGQRQ